MPTNVVIVYHSGYGHTKRLAEAVLEGAGSVEGVDASLIFVEEVGDRWDRFSDADAIIFGAPTYMGSLSGPFKLFMDSTSKIWATGGWRNKIAGGFTNSAAQSGDKLNSLVQLVVYASQMGMIWVGLDLMPGNNSTTGSADELNRIGSMTGVMSQSNADQGPEFAPPSADLRTASYYGKRVAEAAVRWTQDAQP